MPLDGGSCVPVSEGLPDAGSFLPLPPGAGDIPLPEDPAELCVVLSEEALEAIRKNGGAIPLCTVEQPAGKAEVVKAGNAVQFTTKDFAGNTVASDDLFARRKVTMVNIWGTFCGFCIGELTELKRLNSEYAAKGAQIVGIVYDAVEEDLILDARDILSDFKVDYINLLPNEDIKAIFKTQSYPTTYFVNDKGEVLGEPIFGADIAKYTELLDKYLAAE